ncbi:Clp protease N-terminal domain-containing protein [Streptomyces sp. NPDC003077]|uniref:Clp protease N-terminal domain-containing protein n=1 Tax=Streptomyces sp. NPDC003077 TaxID=3154443 RepID=UPI0033B148A0
MLNRTAYDSGADPRQEGPGTRLTAELAAVLSAARRRATRDGDRQVDTAHLLHGLLESDAAVRAMFDGAGPPVARLLGYLVQRSIGYGLRWHGRVEDSGTVPVVEGGAPGWSPAALAAVDGARTLARARRADHADCLDLLAALLGDPESRAVEVLRRASVDTSLVAARLVGDAARRRGDAAAR